MTDPTRGVLQPDQLPRLERVAPAGDAAELVAWFWIPQWDLPDGVESRQPILGYPAANLVVEAGDVTLWGATTRLTERVLRGRGWAVGALLRPAAFARLTPAPADLVDTHAVLDEPALAAAVAAAMPGTVAAAMPGTAAAANVLSEWLVDRIGAVTAEGRLANALSDLMMSDASVLTGEHAAARLHVSVRTLQRFAHRTVGLSPAAMIRRRRLQEAAQRVREHPATPLSEVAADLGYADQAHLAGDFRRVLGFTASEYRSRRERPTDA